jgi:hypothetical protein
VVEDVLAHLLEVGLELFGLERCPDLFRGVLDQRLRQRPVECAQLPAQLALEAVNLLAQPFQLAPSTPRIPPV